MMRYFPAIVLAALALTLSGCAAQQRGDGLLRFAKNPTVVLALDIAQSREAQEKGAYVALRDTAADDAILFAPQPVLAKDWLKAQPPLTNTAWQPHEVYLSCDGKTGVTTGAIQWGKVNGYYTTVWQYYEKSSGKGEWRWVLSHGDMVETPREAPEFLGTKTASCKGRATAKVSAPPEGVQMKQGFSRDQSLSWTWQYRPDEARTLSVSIWSGEGWDQAFIDDVKAPGATAAQ